MAAAGVVVVALTTPLLSDYQRDRLTAFADPSADPQGSGYQTRMVRLAIGAGGMWGQGFMEGERTQAGAVPYQLNDFIFSVAGEELGFVGATGLLAAPRVRRRAGCSSSPRGRRTRSGGWWGSGSRPGSRCRSVQNVGMNLGLLPVTGLPLPFMSYGGSSMLVSWVAIGLVDAPHTPRSLTRRLSQGRLAVTAARCGV